MKKLLRKNKKVLKNINLTESDQFVLKSILTNSNIPTFSKWNAFLKLNSFLKSSSSKISVINSCLKTANKKRFNRLTVFSRHIFLKLIRSGEITGIKKSSW